MPASDATAAADSRPQTPPANPSAAPSDVGPGRLARALAETRAMLGLGVPLALTNLAQMAIGATNVLMIGDLGPGPLAASALAMNLYFMAWVFAMGLTMGAQPAIAQAVGAKRHVLRDVRRSVRMSLWIALGVGLPTCALLWRTHDVLLAFGQDPALAALAGDYGRVMLLSVLPALGFMCLRSFVSALGRTRAIVGLTVFAVALNALGNVALIHGRWGLPALGMQGSALASVIADCVLFGGLLLYVARDRRLSRYRIFGRFWRYDGARLRELLRVGLPIGVALLLEIAVFGGAVLLMGLIGVQDLAAHQIAVQSAAVTFMVPMGIGQAATVRVGLAVGRGDRPAYRLTGWVALALGVIFMGAMAVVFWTMPQGVASLYIDVAAPENAAVVALAMRFMLVAAVFQIADGAQAIAAGVLRGLKDTAIPMLLIGAGYWLIGFPLGAVLAFGLGPLHGIGGIGIWYGLATGLGAVAVLLVIRFMGARDLPPGLSSDPRPETS